eukprot:TRINITY_DN28178_c0_g1_i1.p1 TRINITY_DN28178_c0_g1~~TRINITY_DN28178_c0_g1_i1.p1  ORF type:complete len:557 (+),score=228.60 TRINITY_DN28178_c0_g1_i1:72-1742(+)
MAVSTRQWMEDPVMAKIKRCAMKNGSNGIREMTSAFRKMDANGNNYLSLQELRDGFKGLGVPLTDFESKYVLQAFDKDSDGRLSLEEFLTGLRGDLNPRRRAIVERAFTSLDTDESGYIDINELRAQFSAYNHPGVLKGEMSQIDVEEDFFEQFDSGTNPDGRITREEFEAFYAGVSQNIPSDDYFEMMITETFNIENPTKPRFAPREMPETDVYGNSTKPPHPVTAAEIYAQSSYRVNDRNYNTDHMKGGRAAEPTERNKQLPATWETTQRADYGYYDKFARTFSQPSKLITPTDEEGGEAGFTPTGNVVLDRVRAKILKRAGKRGFRGLARILRIMDDNGNKKLSLAELKEGLQVYQVSVTAHELQVIFKFFDSNGDGSVSVTEFIRGVRGPLTNRRRLALVRMAFEKLDKDGSGVVNYADLEQAYDVSMHPAVLAKEVTAEEAMMDFVEDWDKNRDGRIMFDEFVDYYSDLSAGIDNDNYFELMIRNAWHITGGTGCCANTSNRRVLVVHINGTQEVVEIRDDMGIRADDVPRMLKALEKQGVRDIKRIELAH